MIGHGDPRHHSDAEAFDRRLAGVATANLALSTAREAQLAEQVRIGTKAPPDLYRQQAQARADGAAVIDANNRVQNDETALLNRLRLDATKPYVIVEPAIDTNRVPAAIGWGSKISVCGSVVRCKRRLATSARRSRSFLRLRWVLMPLS